ncbi:MAG: hypothetical protein ABWY20_09850 [Mycobacterium sp.]
MTAAQADQVLANQLQSNGYFQLADEEALVVWHGISVTYLRSG